MSKLKKLELNRLLKELDYIESDFEYRTEVISEVDCKFIESVYSFLENHPELKNLYDNKVDPNVFELNKIDPSKLNDGIDNKSDDEVDKIEDSVDSIENEVDESTSNKLRILYRNIVKITHPDVTNKKRLNEIYIRATDYYDNKDIVGLYKISNELNIDVEIDGKDEHMIIDKLKHLKDRISFLESTFTWKWYETEDESVKNNILLNYIKLRIL